MDSAPAPATSGRRRSERHRADWTCFPPDEFCHRPSVVPMLANASTMKPGHGTANAAPNRMNRILNLSTTDPLARFHDRLRLPLIAAPMFLVSGVDLVVAACRNGVIGAFPTVNCRSPEQLHGWLGDIERQLRGHAEQSGKTSAPICPNLIMHRSNARLGEDLQVLMRHRPEILLTSGR